MKRKLWIILALMALLVVLCCGAAMADDVFTKQPQSASVLPDGKCTITWTTSFIPVNIRIGYYDNSDKFVKVIELDDDDVTLQQSMSQEITYSQATDSSDWVIRAMTPSYNTVESTRFSLTSIPRQFTVQPVGGTVNPTQEGITLSWSTNFVPMIIYIRCWTSNDNFVDVVELDSREGDELSSSMSYTVPYDKLRTSDRWNVVAVTSGWTSINSADFSITRVSRSFITQPSDTVSIPINSSVRLSWSVNFRTVKSEVGCYGENDYEVISTLGSANVNATQAYTLSYSDTAPKQYFVIRDYYTETNYISTNFFTEPAAGFTVTPANIEIDPRSTSQISWSSRSAKKIEVWSDRDGEDLNFMTLEATLSGSATQYNIPWDKNDREYNLWLKVYTSDTAFYYSSTVSVTNNEPSFSITGIASDNHISLEPDQGRVVSFSGNFTPTRIEVWSRDILGTVNVLSETLPGTQSSFEVKYDYGECVYFYAFYGDGEQDYAFDAVYIDHGERKFTLQPTDVLNAVGSAEIRWETNFVPTKIEIVTAVGIPPTYLTFERVVVATYGPSAVSAVLPVDNDGAYAVRAYYRDYKGEDFIASYGIYINGTSEPSFIGQPQNGYCFIDEPYLLSWTVNFTTNRAEVGYIDDNGWHLVETITDHSGQCLNHEIPYSNVPEGKIWQVRAYLDNAWYVTSNTFTIRREDDYHSGAAFTKSPSDGVVFPWLTNTISWSTNFTPYQVEIVFIAGNKTYVFDTITSNLEKNMEYELSYDEAVVADEWLIRAYNTFGECFYSNPFNIEKQQYVTVTFEPNGGECNVTSAQTNMRGKLDSLPVPTREGYTFNYWYYPISNGISVITSDTVFMENITVYANWSSIYYGITVVDGTADRSAAPIGQTVQITANEREYFTFSYWTVVSGGVTLDDPESASTSFVMGADHVKVRAYYTYSGELLSELYVYVTEPVPGAHPAAPYITSDAYNVNSYQWFNTETGAQMAETDIFESGKSYQFNMYVRIDNNMSHIMDSSVVGYVNDSTDGVTCEYQTYFQAHIEKTFETGYTVSFDANGGLGTMEDVTVKESEYVLPSCGFTAPDRWAFVGWDCGQPGTAITVTSDLTVSALWETDCIPVTEENFPDQNFRAYVSSNYDKNGDGKLTQAEREAAVWMMCNNKGIVSFEGIEYFPKLVRLSASNNPDLTALNLSMNERIDTVQAVSCALTDIDVSGCLKLYSLMVSSNPLTSLDVSSNPELHELAVINCSGLSTLDLSGNPDMLWLNTYGSSIKWLDISANAYLLEAYSIVNTGTDEYDHYGNGDYYMKVNKGTEFVNFGCVPVNAAHFPDTVFRTYVADNFDTNESGWLSPAEIAAVDFIDMEKIGDIHNVQGIDVFTEMQYLVIVGCPNLTRLDLRANTRLAHVEVCQNGLTELYIDGLTSLHLLDCSGNALTSLDVGQFTLSDLFCQNNPMISLTLGSQPNMIELYCYGASLAELDITGCPQLIKLYHGARDTSLPEYDEYGGFLLVDKGQKINAGDPEPTFFLPADLTAIESEAFSGITARAVVIPKTVTSISGNPFSGSSVTTVYGYAGSAAQALAAAQGYTFVTIDDAWMASH